MIETTICKESNFFKESIKELETLIESNKSEIEGFKRDKQKLETKQNKYFVQIKELEKTIKNNKFYDIYKNIENNNISNIIEHLKNVFTNKIEKIDMITKWENEIKIANINIIEKLLKIQQLATEKNKYFIEIEKLKETIKNDKFYDVNQEIENYSFNYLKKRLKLLGLKSEEAKLLFKLANKKYEIVKVFATIISNLLKITKKKLLISQKKLQVYQNINTEKQILDAQLNIEIACKISNMCGLTLAIRKKTLEIAEIDEKIANLNIKINKNEICIQSSLAEIRSIYNFQTIKVKIKTWLKLPFMWLNKYFQKYKYEITINKYQMQLQKLEKEITKLETDKLPQNFYHKFWLIISCGIINSHQKNEIREQKIAKLHEIKQKIYQLKNKPNSESQPSNSRNTTFCDEVDCFSKPVYNTQNISSFI